MGWLLPAEAPWCSPCKPVGEDVLIDMEPYESLTSLKLGTPLDECPSDALLTFMFFHLFGCF